MRTIKLLLTCISVICGINISAQVILVPEQKINWLDLKQNRTSFSVVEELCPSLILSTHSPLPVLAFRANTSSSEQFTQPILTQLTISEISSSYFDNHQLQNMEEDFRVEVESVQTDKKNQQVVTVFPFRKRNGKIERLLSFEVQGATSFNETKKNNYTYATHSVLADGDIYKIAIAKDRKSVV